MTTPKQIAANTQNSKQSTGPKSDSGKLAASKNALRHGLLSKRLVISELEKQKEWNTHYQEIIESLSPVGGLEIKLAERIAVNLWRLSRVARYEAEIIHISQEAAIESVTNQRGCSFMKNLPALARNPDDAADWAYMAKCRKNTAMSLIESKENKSYTDGEVRALFEFALKHVKTISTISGQDWPPNRTDFKGWDKETIYRVLEWMAAKEQQDFKVYILNLRKAIDIDLDQAELYAAEAFQDLDLYRRRHLLPSQKVLDLICRYETHLHRAFQRDLHELQRLQAARKGTPVNPPAVLDVDVAVEN